MYNKARYIVFLFFIFNTLLYGINVHDPILLKEFESGNSDFQLKYIWGGPFPYQGSPGGIAIYGNKLFINDINNHRLVVYNLAMNFLYKKDVPNRIQGLYAHYWMIDEKENIIGVSDGILKHDSNLNQVFEIKQMGDEVRGAHNVFLFKEYILYYDDYKKLNILDAYGKKLTAEETDEIKNKIKNEYPCSFMTPELEAFLEQNDLVMLGDKLLNTYSVIYDEFYEILLSSVQKISLDHKMALSLRNDSRYFIGFANNDNTYWKGYDEKEDCNYILVLSKYGEVLDYFKDAEEVLSRAIAPNGDIYFYLFNETVKFYKYRNTWDPITDTSATPTFPKATVLSATSFIDYKNMYIPKMLFDGKPTTAWLEGKKDAGIGESITLTLDTAITVDKLQIAPGYFDKKWWKSNNRIKKLLVELDSYKKEVVFKDEMIMQDVTLEKSTSFKKAKFTILEVYPSGKDNDTAISEIVFYNSGKKVELDLSGIK